jgi:hypothetical protein
MEATKEQTTTRRYQLVNHSIVIGIHPLEQVFEIIHKVHAIMILEWLKERLIAFVYHWEEE